jgi:hypothetical protein
MSGLEVVGVVLGALPLIISGFEHGQSLFKKWNRLANFNSENLKVWNDVKDEELMYRLQLQTLLTPLVRDGDMTKDRLETLLLNPRCDAWKDADIDTALRRRLGEAYDRYIGNVEEIQTLAWRLLEPLARSSTFQTQMSTQVRSIQVTYQCELSNGSIEPELRSKGPNDAQIICASPREVQIWLGQAQICDLKG